MKVIVKTPAVTAYQSSNLREFGSTGFKELGNGKYRFEKEFDSAEEAKDYLIERARFYWAKSSDDNLEEMLEQIKHGSLTIVDITARIEKLEN